MSLTNKEVFDQIYSLLKFQSDSKYNNYRKKYALNADIQFELQDQCIFPFKSCSESMTKSFRFIEYLDHINSKINVDLRTLLILLSMNKTKTIYKYPHMTCAIMVDSYYNTHKIIFNLNDPTDCILHTDIDIYQDYLKIDTPSLRELKLYRSIKIEKEDFNSLNKFENQQYSFYLKFIYMFSLCTVIKSICPSCIINTYAVRHPNYSCNELLKHMYMIVRQFNNYRLLPYSDFTMFKCETNNDVNSRQSSYLEEDVFTMINNKDLMNTIYNLNANLA